ncbi:phage tail termination protein [Orbus mooreae]|uniref:phage tail termination protein n=1 Tax=Orbus mooreae TaxID=3074107 RepID=UPI00370D02C9
MMKMYQKAREYVAKSGLLGGVIIQYLIWKDKGKDKTYLVFRPSGGSSLSGSLGNEYHVLIDFIAPDNDPESIDDLVTNVAEYITQHQFDDCLGFIQVLGAIPTPVTTEDGRIVYRLQISIKHGN